MTINSISDQEKPGFWLVTAVKLDGHGAGAGIDIQAEHLVAHAAAEARQVHVFEVVRRGRRRVRYVVVPWLILRIRSGSGLGSR